MVAMSLPADYGYVIMTGVGAIFMVMWKGIRVGKARKEHGVQYPDMYSPDNKVNLKTQHFLRATTLYPGVQLYPASPSEHPGEPASVHVPPHHGLVNHNFRLLTL